MGEAAYPPEQIDLERRQREARRVVGLGEGDVALSAWNTEAADGRGDGFIGVATHGLHRGQQRRPLDAVGGSRALDVQHRHAQIAVITESEGDQLLETRVGKELPPTDVARLACHRGRHGRVRRPRCRCRGIARRGSACGRAHRGRYRPLVRHRECRRAIARLEGAGAQRERAGERQGAKRERLKRHEECLRPDGGRRPRSAAPRQGRPHLRPRPPPPPRHCARPRTAPARCEISAAPP